MAGHAHFEVYPQIHGAGGGPEVEFTPTGEYGWRLRSANGQIVAVSGESFTRPEDAERACTDVVENVAQAEWVGPQGSAIRVGRVEQ